MILKRGSILIISLIIVHMAIVTPQVIADGEATKNLVLNLEYEIEASVPIQYSYGKYEPDSYNRDSGQLTDGATALTDHNSPDAWYRSMRGVSRIVTFDLGEEKAIYGFYAGFLHKKSMAIYAPRYVYVYLSGDGENYQKICETGPEFPLSSSETRRADIAEDFDRVYRARYVRVEFCSDIFTYCDEIRIFGTDTLSGDEESIIPDQAPDDSDYLRDIEGVSKIIKIYNGYYPTQSIADNTYEELLPYIAYIQQDGTYTDTMFDSVAFVPCHTDYPSGGRLVKTRGKEGAVMSDWLLYLENTFKEGVNVSALNRVAGEVYEALGIEDKLPVFFTLPYPTVISQPFGDIDGDGEEKYCQTLEERVDILKWYADLTYNTFLDGDYDNLEFKGFYWYRESMDYSETDHEGELVKLVTEYVKKHNFSIIFDPFFLSVGFDHWRELGFNGAVMQPNLVFNDYFETEMLEEFASIIKRYNLGVEIETAEPGHFTGSDYKNYGLIYEHYLYYGWKTGYMDALQTFYQGAGPGSLYNFCYSFDKSEKGLYLRSLYDKTYRFLKGLYTAFPPTLVIPDFETAAGQKNVRVPITITDEDSENSEVTVIFTKQPEHGTVNVLPGNKNIVYTANAGYSGIDTFEAVAFDKFNYSEPITVTVTIVDTALSEPEDITEDGTSSETDKKSIWQNERTVWIMLITAGLLVALSSVVIMIIRSKRK